MSVTDNSVSSLAFVPPRSQQVRPSNHFYTENPSHAGAVLVRPARVVAGIAADKGALVKAKAMRIAGAGLQSHLFQYFASLWVIFGHTLYALGIGAAAAGRGEPDEALIVK